MPLANKITNKYGTIGIWKLEETADVLLKKCQLSKKEVEKVKNISSEKRKLEFLASRVLLQMLLPESPKIIYTPNGKPFLKNSTKKISISHSADFVAIFISEYEIGIDIERTNRNTDRIATRFLHITELKFIEKLDNPQFARILYWSAKEAIYKCANEQDVLFNKMILINSFDINSNNEFEGRLEKDRKSVNFMLNFSKIENNIMVFAVLKKDKHIN